MPAPTRRAPRLLVASHRSPASSLFQEADYPLHRQYEFLLFHHHEVVPRLGPRPSTTGIAQWKSFMTDDFSPVEYSWKWGAGEKGPQIRFSLEAVGLHAGTAVDPWNQTATKEMLSGLDATVPAMNLNWFHRFGREFQPLKTDPVIDAGWGSSLFAAFEFPEEGDVGVKVYFIPRSPARIDEFLAGGFKRAVQSISGDSKSLDAVELLLDFLKNDSDGSKLQMLILGIDCVDPIESRVKVYMRTQHTSLDHVTAVMSLGGRKTLTPKAQEETEELWRSTLGLNASFPSSAELPASSHYTSGVIFYFDIKPGCSVPGVKTYIPVRHYGKSDGSIAAGLTKFLERRGMSRYCNRYMSALRGFAEQSAIENSTGIQTYISFAFQNDDELTLASYLSPQVYKKLAVLSNSH